MDAVKRITGAPVQPTPFLKLFQQVPPVCMGWVWQRHPLRSITYQRVHLLKIWNQTVSQSSCFRHGLLPHQEKLPVRFHIHLEQCIALLKRLIIWDKDFDVLRIVLRDYDVHKTATLIAASAYEFNILRRDHDQRYVSYVVPSRHAWIVSHLWPLIRMPLLSCHPREEYTNPVTDNFLIRAG